MTLPEPLRGRRFRLEILRAAFPDGRLRRRASAARGRDPRDHRRRRPDRDVPRGGAVRARCGDLEGTLGGEPVRMRVDATVADLDAGRPLRFRACGPAAEPGAGPVRFSMPAGTFAPGLVRLRSPAPEAVPAPAAPGRVLDPGHGGPQRPHRREARRRAAGLARARPVLQRRLARALRRPRPRRAGAGRRLRDGLAGPGRVPRRRDGVRARPDRARGLPALAALPARDAGAARAAPPAPRRPARGGPARALRPPAPARPRRAAGAARRGDPRVRVRRPRRAADRARHVRDPLARDRRARRSWPPPARCWWSPCRPSRC